MGPLPPLELPSIPPSELLNNQPQPLLLQAELHIIDAVLLPGNARR